VDVGTYVPFWKVASRVNGGDLTDTDADVITLTITNLTAGSTIEVRTKIGFEAFVPSTTVWHPVAITGNTSTSIAVSVPADASHLRCVSFWLREMGLHAATSEMGGRDGGPGGGQGTMIGLL
jgi:hypothetical protein